MPNDHESGAAGNSFGHANAPRLARLLGAQLKRQGSNEATLDGRLVALKSAGVNTDQVGVTYLMLDRVAEVIAAFQREDGRFDVYALSASDYRAHMRATRSTGPSNGRVGKVRRAVFVEKGRLLGTKTLPD